MMNVIKIKLIVLAPSENVHLELVLEHAQSLVCLCGCFVRFYFNEYEINVTSSSNFDTIVKEYLEFQAKECQPAGLYAKE